MVLKFVDKCADTWGMTQTALKALTVAAVSAASILLSGGVALANPGDQPGDCQPGEEFQGGEFGCVAVQLPGETQGRQIDCPDGSVVAMPTACQTPAGEPPVLGQPGPAAGPQPGAAPQAAAPSVAPGSPSAAPQPVADAPAAVPAATAPVVTSLTDLWNQILDWIRMFLDGSI